MRVFNIPCVCVYKEGEREKESDIHIYIEREMKEKQKKERKKERQTERQTERQKETCYTVNSSDVTMYDCIFATQQITHIQQSVCERERLCVYKTDRQQTERESCIYIEC
jgi:cytidylate kinase